MLFTAPEQVVVAAMLLLGGLLIGFALAPSPKKWKRRVAQQSRSFTDYHRDAEDRLRAANQRAADLKAEADALRADHADAERTIAGLRAAAAPRPSLSLVDTASTTVIAAEPESPLAFEIVPAPVPEPLAATEAEVQAYPASVEPETDGEAHDTMPAFKRIDVVPMTSTPSSAAPAPIGAAEPEMPSKGWFASSARDDLTRMRGVDDLLNTRLFGLGVTRFEDVQNLSAEDEMALEQRLSLPVGFIAREQWRSQAALLRAGKDDEHATHFGARDGARAVGVRRQALPASAGA